MTVSRSATSTSVDRIRCRWWMSQRFADPAEGNRRCRVGLAMKTLKRL